MKKIPPEIDYAGVAFFFFCSFICFAALLIGSDIVRFATDAAAFTVLSWAAVQIALTLRSLWRSISCDLKDMRSSPERDAFWRGALPFIAAAPLLLFMFGPADIAGIPLSSIFQLIAFSYAYLFVLLLISILFPPCVMLAFLAFCETVLDEKKSAKLLGGRKRALAILVLMLIVLALANPLIGWLLKPPMTLERVTLMLGFTYLLLGCSKLWPNWTDRLQLAWGSYHLALAKLYGRDEK